MVMFTRFRALPDAELNAHPGLRGVRQADGRLPHQHARLPLPGRQPARRPQRRLRPRRLRPEVDHAPRPHLDDRRWPCAPRPRAHPILRGVDAVRRAVVALSRGAAERAGDAAARRDAASTPRRRRSGRSSRPRSRWRGRASTRARRVFFTTLGHPGDFEQPSMRRLTVNGILWALGRDVPPRARTRRRSRRTSRPSRSISRPDCPSNRGPERTIPGCQHPGDGIPAARRAGMRAAGGQRPRTRSGDRSGRGADRTRR